MSDDAHKLFLPACCDLLYTIKAEPDFLRLQDVPENENVIERVRFQSRDEIRQNVELESTTIEKTPSRSDFEYERHAI
ncbi:hypothetical protein TNCV_3813071 [Trichonephila clavipes]|nr:hypothetical protein TNCV_3813071 [Trichonephila clavipes]